MNTRAVSQDIILAHINLYRFNTPQYEQGKPVNKLSSHHTCYSKASDIPSRFTSTDHPYALRKKDCQLPVSSYTESSYLLRQFFSTESAFRHGDEGLWEERRL